MCGRFVCVCARARGKVGWGLPGSGWGGKHTGCFERFKTQNRKQAVHTSAACFCRSSRRISDITARPAAAAALQPPNVLLRGRGARLRGRGWRGVRAAETMRCAGGRLQSAGRLPAGRAGGALLFRQSVRPPRAAHKYSWVLNASAMARVIATPDSGKPLPAGGRAAGTLLTHSGGVAAPRAPACRCAAGRRLPPAAARIPPHRWACP